MNEIIEKLLKIREIRIFLKYADEIETLARMIRGYYLAAKEKYPGVHREIIGDEEVGFDKFLELASKLWIAGRMSEQHDND